MNIPSKNRADCDIVLYQNRYLCIYLILEQRNIKYRYIHAVFFKYKFNLADSVFLFNDSVTKSSSTK